MSVTCGQCDARSTVTLSAARYHRPLAGTKLYCLVTETDVWVTGIRGLMRGMATLPEGNQEALVVKDKVGRPPGELRVSKYMECDIFPSVL